MEIKGWTSHAEFVVIFVTLLGGYFLIDGKIERQGERIEHQGERTDRLYEMFIDLLKDKCEKV